MSCTAKVTSKDFVTREAESHSRDLLIGPKVTRRLIMVDVFEPLDKSAVAVTCKAVPKLAENSAAGKCRAKLQSAIDAQQFYPESAKRRGIEGDAVVRYWIPPGRDMPADAEIARSSGYPTLDDAALETIRSGKFKSECDYGLGSIKISFKLQE
jgi:TonB family protein